MYRGTWLLAGLPLLIAAFSVARAAPLAPPSVPPSFDRASALVLARELAQTYPDRSPGSLGSDSAARWVAERLQEYGFRTQSQRFEETIPGVGKVPLENVLAVAPGRTQDVVVVMAHRDDLGSGPGAVDNASGTAVLIELARAYAQTDPGGEVRSAAVTPTRNIVFLSTDGGAFGGLGAARFARDPAYEGRIEAVVNIDAAAGDGRTRIELAGESPRSAAPALVQTAAERVIQETGFEPRRPNALAQLIDLGFPFSLYEQAPFVARGVPAITLTTEGGGPAAELDAPATLNGDRLGELGRSAQSLLVSLDEGLQLDRGGAGYVYLGPRFVRGWAIQLVLVAALLPFLAAAVDLFAHCRRRRIPLAPALRSYRSRLGFWLVAGGLFGLFAVLGAWPDGAPRPLAPDSAAARDWPLLGLAGLAVVIVLAWLVGRQRLVRRRAVDTAEELAGYTAVLLVLGVLALVVTAVNAYALLFLLPSLHAWLWLPQVSARSAWARFALLAAGLAGPALLVGSIAIRLDLGLDAVWYLAALVAVGYVDIPLVVVALAWLAAGAQLTALAASRYAPYPSASERPPRGPIREAVRQTVLAVRARRRRRERSLAAEA
jgi:hypothetical protein